ncbi:MULTISPECIES: HlyD family secretion protein [unclassified Rhizobium]|uniref:HlyD family secretion protein n=1 Tax=unclassified Rhizobium TaxID=2613769 RepID=UPI001ADC0423|nr:MULTISPECIES: HlyD family secretion protein [unclassified Rhizobium]MBO9123354.1 HlyD family secretion protein [Rhizobium sp. 16-488-2b]MBO9173886.1 HlyD family secretion protein [Rhizobium sp. 16-488-2a]
MSKFFRSPASLIAIIAGIAGILLVLYAWRLPPFVTSVETTDNAYIRGYVTIMSPQVNGYIVDVPVKDYQQVKQGDVLAKIDDRIYTQKLAQARSALEGQKASLENSRQSELSAKATIASSQAQIDSANASLKRAQLAWDRISNLNDRGIASASESEQAQATLEEAKAALNQAQSALEVSKQNLATIIVNRSLLEANVASAEATVHLAEIDLQNTSILAPRDGHLGEIGVRLGQYVAVGTQLMAVVPEEVWVVANFKETQLEGMQVGQPVSIVVDALGRQRLTGRIERFSPAAGSEFAVIKADNATGNFVKIAQRVGVRISIDPGQPAAKGLGPGLSVVVSVDKSAEPEQKTAAN